MVKKQQPAEAAVKALSVGDTVYWKNIPLEVKEILPDGRIMAWSQTLMVTVSGPEHFDQVA